MVRASKPPCSATSSRRRYGAISIGTDIEATDRRGPQSLAPIEKRATNRPDVLYTWCTTYVASPGRGGGGSHGPYCGAGLPHDALTHIPVSPSPKALLPSPQ